MPAIILAAALVAQIQVVDVDNALTLRRSQPPQRVCTVADSGLVRQVWKKYAATFDSKDWTNLGPDSSFRRITIVHCGKTTTLSSWHPLIENNPRFVALSYGVAILEKRTRAEALKADDPTYVARRQAFDAIVSECVTREKQTNM